MDNSYTPLVLHTEFHVEELFSVHYFEYSSDYVYPGESHDFWEFCYVDKGEITVTAGSQLVRLHKGSILFHKPGEFHSLCANGRVAPNLVVVSFSCNSPSMAWFADKILPITETSRTLMARILDEAAGAFLSPLDDPELKHIARRAGAPPGAEQMLRISLEALLIELYRGGHAPAATGAEAKPASLFRETSRQESIDRVVAYLEQHISQNLTLADICRDNLVGRSYLQKVFREKTGGGVMEYFGRLKIERAKQLIREGRSNFTEISVTLGYNSIHYFSRHFKKVTGMTPSEYASSVKVLTGRSRME